jgi:hypothetical protein
MAVGVVRADRHQGDACVRRGEEVGVGVGAAVVRNLQHVRGQVDAVPDQAALGLGAEVAGEQQPESVHCHPHHHGQVVGCGARHRAIGPRGEHLERGGPHTAPVAGLENGAGARGAP